MKKISKDKSKAKLYKQWRQYLSNSRLNEREQNKRAREFTRKGMKPE